MFCLYLACSDGTIDSDDRDFLNYMFDNNISSADYGKLVKDHNIYSIEFEEQTKISILLITYLDKFVMDNLYTIIDDFEPVIPEVQKLFKDIGIAFICKNGNPLQQEADDYKTYMRNLDDQLNKLIDDVFDLDDEENDEDDEESFYIGKKN